MFYLVALFILFNFGLLLLAFHENKQHINYRIVYDIKNRRVLINNFFILVSFRDGTMNNKIFEYLAKNENRFVTYAELNNEIFKGRDIDLNKVVDSMGFKGDFKKILFTYDNQKIMYHPNKLAKISNIKLMT